MPNVFALLQEHFKDVAQKPLWWIIVIIEGIFWRNELIWVFIEWKISEVHVGIFDVEIIRLLVVLSAETSQTFIAHVSLDGIDTLNDNIET